MNSINNDHSGLDKDRKIEDILKSIRGIIDNHNPHQDKSGSSDEDYDDYEHDDNKAPHLNVGSGLYNQTDADDDMVLELTSEVNSKNINTHLISEEVSRVVQEEIARLKTANELSATANGHNISTAKMDIMVADLLKPMIKEWLNKNLPSLVEQIVSKEIQNIMRRK
jgi:cell pole-organizing protein PopZ